MTKPSVLVIDAGLGNIGSVVAAFMRHDCNVARITTPPSVSDSNTYTHVVLPGVGAFTTGMEALESLFWDRWIRDYWFAHNRPLLGICLECSCLRVKDLKDQLLAVRPKD